MRRAWAEAVLVPCYSLKTLYSPDAAKGYQEHGRRRGWGDDRNNKRGGGGGGGGGARISGMNSLGGGGSGAPPPSLPPSIHRATNRVAPHAASASGAPADL